MGHQVTGLVHQVTELKMEGKGGDIPSRTLVVLEDSEQEWQTFAAFTNIKDKVSVFQGLRMNDRVTVHYNHSSNYWKGGDKWFCGLRAWKVDQHNEPQSNAEANYDSNDRETF